MRIVIVGGGIVGMFSAYYLKQKGHEITVIDRKVEGGETSANSGGLIVPSFATAPSIGVRDVLSTYVGRQAPVYIAPTELLRNLRWLMKARKSLQSSGKTLSEFGMTSLELYRKFFDKESIDPDLQRGVVGLYQNAEVARETARQLKGRFVDADETQKLGFTGFGGGVEFEEELSVDPAKLCTELRKMLSALGVRIILGKEARLRRVVSRIESVRVNGEVLRADAYVLAAGAWVNELCKPIGCKLPVIPARGLVMKFNTGGETVIGKPVLFEDYGMPITQHNRNTVRVTALFELRRFDPVFSESRKSWLLGIIEKHVLSASTLRLAGEGAGFRPCTPDQLPVIGKVPGLENLIVASGHCRLGVTLAPATGQMVESLIEGRTPNLASDFDPARFAGTS